MSMFGEPERESLPAPREPVKPASKAAIKYADYRTVGGKCQDCAQLVLEQRRDLGSSPHMIRQARFKRTQGKSELLLCAEHANIRREQEELAPGKK